MPTNQTLFNRKSKYTMLGMSIGELGAIVATNQNAALDLNRDGQALSNDSPNLPLK